MAAVFGSPVFSRLAPPAPAARTLWNIMLVVETFMSRIPPRMSCNGSYAGIGGSTYPPVCHAMVLMRVSADPRIPPCVMQWFLCGFRPIHLSPRVSFTPCGMQCFLYAIRPVHVSPRVSCNGSYAGFARSTFPPVCHAMLLIRPSPDPRIPSGVMQSYLCGFRPEFSIIMFGTSFPS